VLPPALKHARLEDMREKGKWSGKDKDRTAPTVLRKKDSGGWTCFVRVDQEERNKRSNVNSTLPVATGFKRPAPLRNGEGGSAGVQIAVDKWGRVREGGDGYWALFRSQVIREN
jgi:hypothetical protein